MNKTQPTPRPVADFLAELTPERRVVDARKLIALLEDLSGEPATMWGPSIVGVGRHTYRLDSGGTGEMPLLCFSPRKPHLVLYGLHGGADAEAMLPKLGRFKTEGGCVYVKTLDDIDLIVLERLLADTLSANRGQAR